MTVNAAALDLAMLQANAARTQAAKTAKTDHSIFTSQTRSKPGVLRSLAIIANAPSSARSRIVFDRQGRSWRE